MKFHKTESSVPVLEVSEVNQRSVLARLGMSAMDSLKSKTYIIEKL